MTFNPMLGRNPAGEPSAPGPDWPDHLRSQKRPSAPALPSLPAPIMNNATRSLLARTFDLSAKSVASEAAGRVASRDAGWLISDVSKLATAGAECMIRQEVASEMLVHHADVLTTLPENEAARIARNVSKDIESQIARLRTLQAELPAIVAREAAHVVDACERVSK